MKEELLVGEKIIKELEPHPLSFWPYYLFFLYFIVTCAIVIFKKENIIAALAQYIIVNEFIASVILAIIWLGILIIPALIFSILRISWRWVISLTILAVLGLFLAMHYHVPIEYLYAGTIGLGIIGMILSDIYRRSHKYIITNFRIITKLGFFGLKTRDVLYTRIQDVFVDQGFLGKIFNYGTIIPITASGIGTGEDAAKVAVGMGGVKRIPIGPIGVGVAVEGEKSVKVPRGRSSFVLYGIPNPQEVRKVILEQIKQRELVPFLKKQVELLKELVEIEKKKS